MTREEKVAAARKLRADGCSYREIGLLIDAETTTVYRWLNPRRRERERISSREWKARNKEHLREYNRTYNARRREESECSSCGGPVNRDAERRTNTCMPCIEEANHHRALQIEEWWAEGAAFKEIHERLGWSKGHLSVEIHRLREKGYRLPYRHEHHKNAPRWPEQVVA